MFFISVDLNQNAGFTYTPSLADFEAMRRKEQTLSEIFTELDTDDDGKIGAEELLSFCEDIGRVMTLEKAQKDIKHFDADKDGKIVKDEWIELMFPQFNVQ
jgi:Ca2+-binding EF-hand superfamily protein